MAHLRGLLIAWTLVLALLGAPASRSHAQPADESADAMNARLAAATLTRVGPSYLYPAHASASGLVNPDITQANIDQTICNSQWSTKSIRPPVSYTNNLKTQQLTAAHATDKTLAHYEEDDLVSLELGGHPRDPRNLWPERWGTPGHPLTSRGPFPAHLVGAKAKDATENALHHEVCHGTLTLREARSSSPQTGSSTTGRRCSSEPRPTLVDSRVAMAEREYYCAGCETPHAAALWFVHQVGNTYGPLRADYLCGSAHSRLRPIEQARWALLV